MTLDTLDYRIRYPYMAIRIVIIWDNSADRATKNQGAAREECFTREDSTNCFHIQGLFQRGNLNIVFFDVFPLCFLENRIRCLFLNTKLEAF